MEQLITALAEHGILALLLAISLLALWFMFGKYTEEVTKNDALQEKRISDYKEMKDVVLDLLKEIKQTTASTLQSILNRKND